MSLLEIDVARHPHPVDMIEQVANDNEWAFERTGDDEIAISVAGHWSDYHVSFSWMEDFEALHLACAFDVKVPENRALEVMRLLVPTGNELPSLIDQVSTAARREGLDIASLEPQPIIQGEMFDTYRYKVSVTGGYHALGEFLTNVGSLTRIVAPVNLNLGLSGNRNANAVKLAPAGTAAVESKFEIQTYVIRTAPAAQGGQ